MIDRARVAFDYNSNHFICFQSISGGKPLSFFWLGGGNHRVLIIIIIISSISNNLRPYMPGLPPWKATTMGT
jgi:hypothetical protein